MSALGQATKAAETIRQADGIAESEAAEIGRKARKRAEAESEAETKAIIEALETGRRVQWQRAYRVGDESRRQNVSVAPHRYGARALIALANRAAHKASRTLANGTRYLPARRPLTEDERMNAASAAVEAAINATAGSMPLVGTLADLLGAADHVRAIDEPLRRDLMALSDHLVALAGDARREDGGRIFEVSAQSFDGLSGPELMAEADRSAQSEPGADGKPKLPPLPADVPPMAPDTEAALQAFTKPERQALRWLLASDRATAADMAANCTDGARSEGAYREAVCRGRKALARREESEVLAIAATDSPRREPELADLMADTGTRRIHHRPLKELPERTDTSLMGDALTIIYAQPSA